MICMRESVVNPPLYVGTCLVYNALLGRFFVKIIQASLREGKQPLSVKLMMTYNSLLPSQTLALHGSE